MVLRQLFWKLFLLYAVLVVGCAGGLVLLLAVRRSDAVAAHVAETIRWPWVILLAVAVVGLGSWWLGRMLEPLARLTENADALAAGKQARRLYLGRTDEIGGLAEAFDRMLAATQARETRLRETADRLATVLGGMIEGVLAVDHEQRVLLANEAAASMLGFHAEESAGKRLLEVTRNHMLHRAVSDALEHQRLTEPETQTLEITSNSARETILSFQATRLPGDPCPGVVLVLHDVTALRRLEFLRQEFVANVSHELKTPLSSIKAYAETLADGALNDPSINRKFVGRIQEQTQRLQDLIMDMLRLSQIESGQQEIELCAVPLAKVAAACVGEFEQVAADKGISLALTGDDQDLCVRAAPEGLRQILENLIDNAIKYTPTGGRVTVHWQRAAGLAELSVRDTGIGIPADAQPRVFERFFRVDKARSRELGSTGLGLAIVKHLAQTFGGNVSVESQPGRGSQFTVRLPLAPS